jgi:hypothetical protein
VASKTQICNIALVRIGVTKFLTNVETDKSKEASALNLVFDDERDYVLRDFPWPFATSYAQLNLVSGSLETPTSNDWIYAYRYPSDCMFARRITTVLGRAETQPPPFKIGRDSQGRLVYTNQEDAELEYTLGVTDPAEFDSVFDSMLAWKLAKTLAPSASRIKGIIDTCNAEYERDRIKAQVAALNEQQQEQPPESEMIQARA